MTMPQGPTGIESAAWGAEWITTNTASEFHDRTRNAVETHYKTTLTGNSTTAALQPWTTARDALFNTLMSGFASINAFISMLSGAIAGAVGGTLTTIANFMTGLVTDVGRLLTNLLNAANEFIGDIGKGIVDGVVTVAGWLNNLWMTLTGQTGTGKKVSDVSTALSTVTSNANIGKQVAETARDNLNITWNELYDGLDGTTTPVGTQRNATQLKGRGAAVRASAKIGEGYYYAGANILINPGFEDTDFAILNQGVAVTANVGTGDVARSGTRSLRLVAAAGNPFSYLSANTTSQVFLPCTAGETYYFECWVRGKSTNTQATAANGIILGITTYDSAKANPVNVTVSFAAGTAYNADWVKVSGKLLVPAGKSFFTPYVGLSSTTVTNGHTYYFDDVVVREITDAQAASAAAGTADSKAVTAQNAVDLRSRDFSNLVVGSDFDAVTQPWTLTTGFTISTAQKNSGTQSMQIVGTATAYPFVPYNNYQAFEAKPGEKFYMECWVRKLSTYVGGDTSGPRLMMVRGNGVNVNQPIDSRYLRSSDIAAADTWQKLSVTTVAVPSDTSSVYFALAGMPANAAGSLWVDDIVVRRVVAADVVADLPQSKVTDLTVDLGAAASAAANAQGGVTTLSDGAYNAWYGSGGAGSTAQMSGTISAIKTAIAGGFTVEVLTTSGTWTRPAPVAQILDFWAICIGGGGGGGKGATGTSSGTSYSGGSGGAGGGYVAQQINPADLGATISYTVGSGGAAGTTTASPVGTASTFGSLATSVSGSATASISSLFGFYDAVSSAPGDGGRGGNSAPSATSGVSGGSTPLAAGGAGASNANGGAGGTASLTGQSRAGGGGGGGGGGLASGVGRSGGAGGFPGGGAGGGAGVNSSLVSQTGGAGGVGANGAIVLLYKKATV